MCRRPEGASDRGRRLDLMNWLQAYGIETVERPSQLGQPATLTVIMRDLSDDSRSFEFLPIQVTPPGDEQRAVILRAMADRHPDARWKTYNRDKQVASFVSSRYLYIVAYEEHEVDEPASAEQPALFAV
jgi:hypothetical protein